MRIKIWIHLVLIIILNPYRFLKPVRINDLKTNCQFNSQFA